MWGRISVAIKSWTIRAKWQPGRCLLTEVPSNLKKWIDIRWELSQPAREEINILRKATSLAKKMMTKTKTKAIHRLRAQSRHHTKLQINRGKTTRLAPIKMVKQRVKRRRKIPMVGTSTQKFTFMTLYLMRSNCIRSLQSKVLWLVTHSTHLTFCVSMITQTSS